MAELRAATAAAGDDRNWQAAPLPELVGYIPQRFHEPLRAELPRLGEMMAKVVSRARPFRRRVVAGELAHPREGTRPASLDRRNGRKFRGLYYGLAEMEREMHIHVHLEQNVLFPWAASLAAAR